MAAQDNNEVLTLGTKKNGEIFKFFVVDDSAFMLQNLERILKSLGGEVIATAADGVEAVRKYSGIKEMADIVTLDITMPHKDGLHTLIELKEKNPDVIAVMVSALGHEQVVKQAILSGAKHFIVKPFKRADVYQILTSVITKYFPK